MHRHTLTLVKESRLLVGNAQLAVDGSKDALHLTEGEHTAQKRVAGIMAVTALIEDAARLVGKRHTVIYTHRQLWVFFLENPAQLDEVGTSAQM